MIHPTASRSSIRPRVTDTMASPPALNTLMGPDSILSDKSIAESMVTFFITKLGECGTRDEVLQALKDHGLHFLPITGITELRAEIPEVVAILETFTDQDVTALADAVNARQTDAVDHGADVPTVQEIVKAEVLKAVIEVAFDLLKIPLPDRDVLRHTLDALLPKPFKDSMSGTARAQAGSMKLNFPALWRTVVSTLFKGAQSPADPRWTDLQNLTALAMFSAKYRREAQEGEVAETQEATPSAALPDLPFSTDRFQGVPLSPRADAQKRTVQESPPVPAMPARNQTEPSPPRVPIRGQPLLQRLRQKAELINSFPKTSLFRKSVHSVDFALNLPEFSEVCGKDDFIRALANLRAPDGLADNPLLTELFEALPETMIPLRQMSADERASLQQLVVKQTNEARNRHLHEADAKRLVQGAAAYGIARFLAATWVNPDVQPIDWICQRAFPDNSFVECGSSERLEGATFDCSAPAVLRAFIDLYAAYDPFDDLMGTVARWGNLQRFELPR